ncbi:hypothetical protein F4860DRAFT_515678 [Xylaria cubensis]|nr:hypothetical protein F4860DRAFT_515678 [Xylaria cubensis]
MPNHIPPKAPGTLRAPPEKTPQQAQQRANMPLMRPLNNLRPPVKRNRAVLTAPPLAGPLLVDLLNLLTFGLWGKLGRLGHYALDAVLISTILAGMRRSTGLTVRSDRITGENGEMHKWVNKYLGVGEWVLDQSVAFAGTSKYFERTR